MLTATCHCGAVQIDVPRKPRRLTSCNCSICRRYATLWAYYPESKVGVRHARGAVDRYAWGDKALDFVTLGALAPHFGQMLRGTKRHPTIEDRVVIYANATILGGATEGTALFVTGLIASAQRII